MKFNSLYQELKNSTKMIQALLTGITQEDAQLKPNTESWSILEVVCHLYDEEREDFREHLDSILHRQNEEWPAFDPQGWVQSQKYNEQDFEEMLNKFIVERRKPLDWLAGLSNADWEITHTSKYGSMSAGEMFASWIAHDNLHIRQLVELKRLQIEKMAQPFGIKYAEDW